MAVPQYNGVDVPIFAFLPQWKDSISLEVENRTDIAEALSTVEERTGLFPRPLYHPSFTIQTMLGRESATLRRILDLADALPIGVPLWMDACKLTAQPASSTISVDWLANSLFSVIRSCLIVQDFETFEVFPVSSINEGAKTITLAGTPDSSTPVGTFVVPIVYGLLARGNMVDQSDEIGTFEVKFEETWNGLSDQSQVESGNTDDPEDHDTLESMMSSEYVYNASLLATLDQISDATYAYVSAAGFLVDFGISEYNIVTSALSGTDQYGFESMEEQIVDGPVWRT